MFCLRLFVQTNRNLSEGNSSLNRLRSNSELPGSPRALAAEKTEGDGGPSSEARAFGTRGGQLTAL